MTVHIITGPPAAGKSTYARDHAKPGDVVVDYDALATALGSTTAHASTGAPRKAALAARQAAIDAILDGIDTDAWIIHTSPRQDQLDRYRKAGAHMVTVDPGIDNVIRQAQADRRPSETTPAIRAWYAARKNTPAQEATPPMAFTQEQRDMLAAKHEAMPDGSYPIRNKTDLARAIKAIGRAKNKAAARAWIISRAKALDATGLIPASWR